MSRSIARILMIAVACVAILAFAGAARAAVTGANPVAWLGAVGPTNTPVGASTRADTDGDADGSTTNGDASDAEDAQNSDQSQGQEVSGVIASVDPVGSTFSLTTATGAVTITVTSATEFEDGLSGLASLQPGTNVSVEEAPQAAGQALAAETVGANDTGATEGADLGGSGNGR